MCVHLNKPGSHFSPQLISPLHAWKGQPSLTNQFTGCWRQLRDLQTFLKVLYVAGPPDWTARADVCRTNILLEAAISADEVKRKPWRIIQSPKFQTKSNSCGHAAMFVPPMIPLGLMYVRPAHPSEAGLSSQWAVINPNTSERPCFISRCP